MHWYNYLWLGYALLAFGYACWRGQRDERIVSVSFMAASLLTPLLHSIFPVRWATVDYVNLTLDSMAMILFTAIALRSRRNWPIWVAAFELVALSSHLARAIDPGVGAFAYVAMTVLAAYGIPLSVALGSWYEVERPKRRGLA